MRETSLFELAACERQQRYRVSLLADADIGDRGIGYRDADRARLLEWRSIRLALAAEVGEPEGVRTIIFDLVTERVDTPGGLGFEVRRLGIEPGEDAMRAAGAIAMGIGERASASIKSLAAEGTPSLWYPDLDEFEAAALESLVR